MDAEKLFGAIRHILGPLSQVQVDCTNAILDSCSTHGVTDTRHIAYIIATGIHEAALKPIAEHLESRNGRPYNNPDPVTGLQYYGRGCPAQITWKSNYQSFGKALGIDLVNHPELALDIKVGADIGVIGMRDGRFTGVGLSKYFNDTKTDAVSARKIINGLDKAELIAGYWNDLMGSQE